MKTIIFQQCDLCQLPELALCELRFSVLYSRISQYIISAKKILNCYVNEACKFTEYNIFMIFISIFFFFS